MFFFNTDQIIIRIYHISPQYLDSQAWINSVNLDQAPNMPSDQSLHCCNSSNNFWHINKL